MMMFCDKVCILAGRWVDIAVCLCPCECVSVCLGVCVCERERGTADAEALLLIKSSCSIHNYICHMLRKCCPRK